MSIRRPRNPWRVRLFSSDGPIHDSDRDFRSSQAAYDHVIAERQRTENGEGPVTTIRVLQWTDGDWALYERITPTRPAEKQGHDMSGIYDDGATYGPDPNATATDTPTDPIYDDGDTHGQSGTTVTTGRPDPS
ncbi:hypothetical protein ABR737_00175 [Streptomyces sp. Edi2]|uniref:hypothetical protein n=1 Tax=Streptomyces sp. Edi2 TaxID=3162528 RepID=UPI0033057DD4